MIREKQKQKVIQKECDQAKSRMEYIENELEYSRKDVRD